MELKVLDPFGDYQTEGYLRNLFKEKDLEIVGHLETAAFEAQVLQAIRFLRRQPTLNYEHILETHRQLFDSLYPWAGQDRSENAPHIAIAKAGYKTLFATSSGHPQGSRIRFGSRKGHEVFTRPSRRSFWLFSSRTSFP